MLVEEIMSTGVVTAVRGDTVRSVVTKMLSRNCGAIPVVDEGERLVGMVTLRDVMIPLYPQYGDYVHDSVNSRDFIAMEEGYASVLAKKVEEIMSAQPLSVSPRTPALEAASFMGLKHFRRIPVVEKGRLVGMISISDINRGLFFAQQRDSR